MHLLQLSPHMEGPHMYRHAYLGIGDIATHILRITDKIFIKIKMDKIENEAIKRKMTRIDTLIASACLFVTVHVSIHQYYRRVVDYLQHSHDSPWSS